jgi:hypothetical protein
MDNTTEANFLDSPFAPEYCLIALSLIPPSPEPQQSNFNLPEKVMTRIPESADMKPPKVSTLLWRGFVFAFNDASPVSIQFQW